MLPLTGDWLITGPVALAFALVHLFGRHLMFLHTVPRSFWLSAAGGISVAYVFVHVLPELASHQETIREQLGAEAGLLADAERHSYLLALVGLASFYGLERLARRAARRNRADKFARRASSWVYILHLGAYAIYNALIGYLLLHREEMDPRGLVIYAVAMGLHFIINDQGLREHHGRLYEIWGRWVLAAAPLLGWAAGLTVDLPPLSVAALFAFLAGAIVLNVLKEELPEERDSRFSAFALGAAAYAALLIVTR